MTPEQSALHLRLEPYLTVVSDGDTHAHLMVGEKVLLRCHGRLVPLITSRLLPSLDGSLSVQEVCEQLDEVLPRQSTLSLLDLLLRHRVVYDTSAERQLPPQAAAAFAGLLHLLGRLSESPFELLQHLLASRVVVVGDSPLVRDIAQALGGCAIGQVELLSDSAIAPIPEQPFVRVRAHPLESLEQVVPGCALVVGVQDGDFAALPLLRKLNRYCVAAGASWLHVRLTLEGKVWLGPLYMQDEACFECVRLRFKTNLETWRESSLHELGAQRGELPVRRLGHMPLQAQVGTMVATQVVRILSHASPPPLASRVQLVDLLTLESHLHTVLKHPLCPVCSRAQQGPSFPWEEEDLQLERLLV